jgi:hypothetical protein
MIAAIERASNNIRGAKTPEKKQFWQRQKESLRNKRVQTMEDFRKVVEGDGGETRKLIASEHTETRRKIVEDLKEYIKEMFQPVNKALGLTEESNLGEFKTQEALVRSRRIAWEITDRDERALKRQEAADEKRRQKAALAQEKAAKSAPAEPEGASSSSKPPVPEPMIEPEAEVVEEPVEKPAKRQRREIQCNDCEAPPFRTQGELKEHMQLMCMCPDHNPAVLIPKAAFKKDGAKNESKTRVGRIIKAYVAQGTKVMGPAPKLLKKFGKPNEWLVDYAEAHEKAIHEIKLANKGRFEDEPVPEPVEEVPGGADVDAVIAEPADADEAPDGADGSEVVMM